MGRTVYREAGVKGEQRAKERRAPPMFEHDLKIKGSTGFAWLILRQPILIPDLIRDLIFNSLLDIIYKAMYYFDVDFLGTVGKMRMRCAYLNIAQGS